jgi:hypothetical protein
LNAPIPPASMVAGDSEWKLWVGKIKVSVDGVDVTSIARAYDLTAQTVEIHVRNREGVLLRDCDFALRATISGNVEVSAT